MKVIYPGHRYELAHLDGDGASVLQFVQRAPLHPPCEGTQCQEVLRALIDRVKVLDAEIRWPPNDELLKHLRMALALFEARALLRHVEKGHLHPEQLAVGPDGHFIYAAEGRAGQVAAE
jgi:hypothetical protein